MPFLYICYGFYTCALLYKRKTTNLHLIFDSFHFSSSLVRIPFGCGLAIWTKGNKLKPIFVHVTILIKLRNALNIKTKAKRGTKRKQRREKHITFEINSFRIGINFQPKSVKFFFIFYPTKSGMIDRKCQKS